MCVQLMAVANLAAKMSNNVPVCFCTIFVLMMLGSNMYKCYSAKSIETEFSVYGWVSTIAGEPVICK